MGVAAVAVNPAAVAQGSAATEMLVHPVLWNAETKFTWTWTLVQVRNFLKKIASFIRGRLGYCCLIGCFYCYRCFHWWDLEPHGSHFDGDVADTSSLDCALKNRRSWFALMRWGCVSVYSIVPFVIDFPMREMKQEAYWITSLGFQLPWVGLDKTGCKYMKNNCTAETVGPNEVQPFSYPIQIMQAYPVVSF